MRNLHSGTQDFTANMEINKKNTHNKTYHKTQLYHFFAYNLRTQNFTPHILAKHSS